MEKNDAFTGLEAGLVLIAFIVVASVFSYVVLSAGFFSVQKSQSVIYSAVEQGSSTMILGNDIIGFKNQTTGKIDRIRISLGSPYALVAIDLSKASIIVVTSDIVKKIEKAVPLYSADDPPAGFWRIIRNNGNEDSKNTLESGDYIAIMIHLPDDMQVGSGEDFRVSIIPPLGAPLSADRTAPQGVGNTVILN
jgi:flagellin FlaB